MANNGLPCHVAGTSALYSITDIRPPSQPDLAPGYPCATRAARALGGAWAGVDWANVRRSIDFRLSPSNGRSRGRH